MVESVGIGSMRQIRECNEVACTAARRMMTRRIPHVIPRFQRDSDLEINIHFTS
jgi:hypothetical protein